MKRFHDMKIKKKLGIVFGFMVLNIVLVNGFVNYFLMDRAIGKMVRSELIHVSENLRQVCQTSVDSSINNYLRSISEKACSLVRFYYNQYRAGKMSEADALQRVRRIFKDPKFGKIGDTGYLAAVSSRGILTIHPKSEGVNASKHAFMQRAMKKKNGFLSYKWKNKGEKVEREKVGWMTYFKPWDLIVWASSYKDEFYHLVDMDTLSKAINAIRIGKTGYAFILNSKGVTVIHRDFKNKNLYNTKDETGRYFLKEISRMKNGYTEYVWRDRKTGYIGKKVLECRYYAEMDWIICVSGYKKELYASKDMQRIISILLILISLVVIVPVILILSDRITRPVKELSDTFSEIADGDLTCEIKIHNADEIGRLSERVNSFIRSLHDQVISIKKASYSITGSIHDLNASSKEIAATSNQQAASVKEVVTTMEDSDALARGITNKINEVARIADSTRDIVVEGSGMIQKNLEMMGEIRQKNSDTITGISALNGKIKSIWEIVNIINGIADQTKIIAFNAELEASAAGEAGKNFEIVADEIRRLADNTVSSTNEIKAKIEEIQHSSDKLIISSEHETDRIRQGWELSSGTGELFQKIQQSSEVSARSAGEIARSIEQQTAAFNQILITMKQISEGIDNFVISTKSTSQASESLKDIAEGLTGLVEEYTVNDEE